MQINDSEIKTENQLDTEKTTKSTIFILINTSVML